MVVSLLIPIHTIDFIFAQFPWDWHGIRISVANSIPIEYPIYVDISSVKTMMCDAVAFMNVVVVVDCYYFPCIIIWMCLVSRWSISVHSCLVSVSKI